MGSRNCMVHVPVAAWILQVSRAGVSAPSRFRLTLLGWMMLLAVIVGFAVPGLAQVDSNEVHVQPREAPKPPTPPQGDPADVNTHTRPMRVDVNIVLVPVTVTDPDNRLVTGLEKENFEVLDQNIPQQIRHFSSEDAPVSIGVIFDMSGSMSNKIDKSREAIVEFFKTANPDDEFFVVAFNDKPEVLQDFTNRIEDIQEKLTILQPKDRTSLLDAIYLGMNKMRQAKYERKALLIISDGGDNHSRYTENEIKSMVREADVQIYAIGIYDLAPTTTEEMAGPALLGEISDWTGGRMFPIDNVNELADVATKIGVELRNQYVLGYRPSKPAKDGKWRKIKVRLNPPKGLPPLHVFAKTGYYAPSE
ncbi:von Willebrand factor, type A [Candidatus Koribacter versatilis Ellin345]|uniref:von Willebrand factor, type A n=2 Tax=Candidatus Korobacter versatilis TaxID=658062 RepID=Q1INP3_KORVE|nr:von Willebrand factor, type A [Candidatus Koribacter versatilis Ellin345]